MATSIDYYKDMVDCPNCGIENEVDCISEQNTGESEIFNSVVPGKCSECGESITKF